MVDLHVHSTRSDGTYTPKELVNYAIEKGLSAFALTDHDTVDGLDEAIEYAQKLQNNPLPETTDPELMSIAACQNMGNIHVSPASFAARKDSLSAPLPVLIPEVIPGIELSTEYEGKDIHVVGLAIDHHNRDFTKYLADFVASRDARNEKMCRLLCDAGIDISYEALLKEFPDSVITRAHYAKYMLNHGYIKSMKEAFDRYVGDHCPYFVPREKVLPSQAVELILGAGGIPVLAHPILYHMSEERLENLVKELKETGLIGIEAIYSTYDAADERQIRRLASKYDLKISGGSDFHGSNKPGLDLAVGYGKLYVHDSVWKDLKETLA